jgi:hypothetical protein
LSGDRGSWILHTFEPKLMDSCHMLPKGIVRLRAASSLKLLALFYVLVAQWVNL